MRIINELKNENEFKLSKLILSGYTDLGWMNGINPFSQEVDIDEELDCSEYLHTYTDLVQISHKLKEFVHVDMSD